MGEALQRLRNFQAPAAEASRPSHWRDYHSKMVEAEFAEKPRGLQVLEDVWRRKPSQWLALDDIDEGWPVEDRSRVFITDARLGLSSPGVEDAIRQMLEDMHR